MTTTESKNDKIMKIDLTRAVKSYKKVTTQDVINEAVVNSLQANAPTIDITIDGSKDLLGRQTILKITIKDSGDGFNEKNRNGFLELYTANKESKGCQGIGRLSYLKVFKNINIDSKQNNEHVKFNFTTKLDDTDLTPKSITENTKETILTLENLNKEEFFDIDKIYNETFNHIYPFLFLNENDCKITINGDKTISKDDVKSIEHTDFTITKQIDNKDISIKFDLWYRFQQDNKTILDDFVCINKRPTKHFYHKPLCLSIYQPEKYRTTFLLESKWLDSQSNQYHDIEYEEGEEEAFEGIDWLDVKKELINKINELLNAKFKDYKEQKAKQIQVVKDKYLYLSDYIEDEIGFVGEDKLLEKARKRVAKEEDTLMQMKTDNKTSDVEFLKQAKKVVSHDLIKYILDRQNIIDKLINLKGTNIEKEVHNLFLEQGLEGTEERSVPLDKNNLWLLDDKFMSYSYIASEKAISTFLEKAGLEKNSSNEEMDIVVYFDSNDKKRAVIIELKKLTANYKENGQGIDQLSNYANQLSEVGVKELYLYLFANIEDDRFRKNLEQLYKFRKVFSHKGEIYQGSLDGITAYIQIISPDAIIADADARNKTFLIFIKNSTRAS